MPFEHKEKNFDKKYGKALRTMKAKIADSCPEAEVLLRYYRHELAPAEAGRIQQHVDICPDCLLALTHVEHAGEAGDTLPENWPTIEREMDRCVYLFLESKAAGQAKPAARINLLKRLRGGIRRLAANLAPEPVAYAGLMAAVLIGIVYSYAYLSRPAYFDPAQIHRESIGTLRNTAAAENELQQGIRSFARGNYSHAIEKLGAAIPASPNNYITNYYLGLAYLMDAKKTLPGLAYDFDAKKVSEGKRYLQNALTLSGDNAFYQEDNYWYLAKAYLMEGGISAAKLYLNKILALQRPGLMRQDAARKLLDALK